MTEYKSWRIIDGKPRWVIVDENEKIINKYPSKQELKGIEKKIYIKNIYYNDTNTCSRIKDNGEICGKPLVCGNARRECNKVGVITGRWVCTNCWHRTLSDSRTGNLDSNCSIAKGNKFQKLSNESKSLIDLNIENDDRHSPIDSIDPVTGLYYQTKGALYDRRSRSWHANFKSERRALSKGFKFHRLIYYCASEDGKIIDRMYEFTEEEIKNRSSIEVSKNPTDSRKNPIIPWYEKYRVIDEEELNKVREIWKKIIDN